MKQRSWAGLGVVSVLSAIIVATVAAQGASTYSGAKVELNYLHGYVGSDQVIMDEMIKNFNASHNNIVVKGQGVPWSTTWQQLPSLVAAGKAPDVMAMTEEVIGNFMARKALSELTANEVRTSAISGSAFYKNLWQAGFYDNKQYGVPLSSAAQVMFYNKDLLKKYGIAAVPTTRAQFLAATQACTVDKAGRKLNSAGFDAANLETYGVGIMTPWMGGTIAYGILRGNGGNLVDRDFNAAFNSPAGVAAVQLMLDLVGRYKVSPSKLTEESDIASFKAGKTCFNLNGVWQLTGYLGVKSLNLGVAPMPRLGSRQAAAWGASVHLVLPVQRVGYETSKRSAALEFIRWMSESEQNLFWTKSGALPTRPSVASSATYQKSDVADVAAGLAALYIPTGFPWVSQVRNAWDAAVENALLGKKTVKQSLDDGVKEAQTQIDEVRQSLPK